MKAEGDLPPFSSPRLASPMPTYLTIVVCVCVCAEALGCWLRWQVNQHVNAFSVTGSSSKLDRVP